MKFIILIVGLIVIVVVQVIYNEGEYDTWVFLFATLPMWVFFYIIWNLVFYVYGVELPKLTIYF